MYWLIIILGTFILSLSLSNPFYKLLIAKRLKFNTFLKLLFRTFLLILGLILIFIGLYLESI